jgi:hypothetical protein
MCLRCLAVLIGCVAIAAAQDPLQGLLPPKDGPQRAKVLVLKTGQVLNGDVEARLGGYTVRMTSGSLVIPYEQVRVAGASLDDAYVRMRDALSRPNATNHLELGRWCLQVGLPVRAKEQAGLALQLEPDRTDARALLLEADAKQPSRPVEEEGGIVAASRIVSADGALPVTPAGLSRDRVAEYMRQVQPLLLNSCATAACHGGNAGGGLKLQATGRLSRADSDANLAAVLQFINAAAADQSPLLTAPRLGTGAHADAFRGPKSRGQLDRLTAWTRLVAAEAGGGGAGVVPAVGYTPAKEETPAPLPERTSQVDDSFLRRVIAEEQSDAFDPTEFNRRVHGK